ncbi:serine/threonine protein kinase [Pseudochrobactrum algeriensis]|uniref:Serine/threonine protein kinase n=1 Tax=Pseudochrobactrum saccharolyticum TaxID=354352 RepID=A0A7W8AKC7_9HYPH|nr:MULTISPECIES: serine/threonine protein kinase [Pseudochrobactrum]MBX8811683.1 serine/threonine protein kinase [Ochrobactrum sp. MR34]KAB0537706.1 serine/threonine protein kinase [Pseudochrobactrum saccharolyticum]MBB5091909.1 serine/threonine protein kinase [Pseudochrobactrum saccharolyticum]MDP8250249.1 serine/threonine protein kinase [Pseudochrobactrum saccharolyticum]QVQ35877.1 serine/threonine protein kinase [Pseudochrobactrum algeriensis]
MNYSTSETNSQLMETIPDFYETAVFKRDIFSETRAGYFVGEPETRIIRRVVSAAPWWSSPLAWWLARREIRGLKKVRGIKGTPQLLATDKHGLFRTWTDGTPLHLARPSHREWYLSAHRILRDMRRMGVTHNDLQKPQNWLMTPEGEAAVIDFQLASVHRRRGAYYRLMAYEDFRHLIKQKRNFAPDLMTPTEKRILARRSLPSRIWLATGKKVYNFVTRGIFNWSDGEGTGDRIDNEGPAIIAALKSDPRVKDVSLSLYSLPAKGVGIYAFVETLNADEKSLRARLKGYKVELIQPVAHLPRREDGTVREDILRLVAMNQMTELDDLLLREPDMRPLVEALAAHRLNFTDRRITQME